MPTETAAEPAALARTPLAETRLIDGCSKTLLDAVQPLGAIRVAVVHPCDEASLAAPRPFIITDAAINIAPTLEEKADIVRNAVEIARPSHE
jgi:hypothetical protein